MEIDRECSHIAMTGLSAVSHNRPTAWRASAIASGSSSTCALFSDSSNDALVARDERSSTRNNRLMARFRATDGSCGVSQKSCDQAASASTASRFSVAASAVRVNSSRFSSSAPTSLALIAAPIASVQQKNPNDRPPRFPSDQFPPVPGCPRILPDFRIDDRVMSQNCS